MVDSIHRRPATSDAHAVTADLEMQAPARPSSRAQPRPLDAGGPPVRLTGAQAAKLAQPHAERARATLGPRAPGSLAARFVAGTDAVQLLGKGDDDAYLHDLGTERALLHGWADQVDADLAAHAPHIDPRLHAKLATSVEQLRASVDGVQGSAGARVALVGVFLMLAAYPVALTMLAQPKELRSFVLLLAATTKSAVVVAGEIRRPTTNRHTIADIAKNRLWANIEQALLLTPQATRSELGKHLAESGAYNIGVIFASFALLVAAFWGPAAGRALADSARDMASGKAQPATRPETVDMLHAHRDTAHAFHDQVTGFTSALRDAGGVVTRGANARKGDILAAIDGLQQCLQKAAGDRPRKLPNKDLVPKAIGSVAALTINTAAIMTFLGESIAVADMSADDVFTACVLATVAADPNKDAHDVAKSFQDWVALSAWLIPTMSVNAGLGNPIAHSRAAFGAYAAVVPAGNLVFSAWIGKGLSEAIGWAFDKFRRGDGEGGVAAIRDSAAFARRMQDIGLLAPASSEAEPTPGQRDELDALHRRIGLVPAEPRVVELDGEPDAAAT